MTIEPRDDATRTSRNGRQAADEIVVSQRQALRQLLQDVWSEGRVEPVDMLIADRYTIFHDPGDPWHGKTLTQAEYRDRVTSSRTPFPDQAFTVQEMIAEPYKIAVSWLWQGTHKKAFGQFEATGRLLRMSGLTIYFFDGDRISGHWQMVDRLAIYQQFMEAAGQAPAG